MLEFLSNIMDAITSFISFLFNSITNFISVLALIPQGVAFLTTAAGFLPSFITVFVILGITISIVLFIIGR